MTDIIIDIGGELFRATYETKDAPKTVARFRELLPYRDRIIHVRWSGEACWIPMGERDLSIGYENATSYPAPGQIIVHPGHVSGESETEILLAYGPCCFASKAGQPGRQPLPDDPRRPRAAGEGGPLGPVGRREGNRVPRALMIEGPGN
nr:DUF3830 family protein [uncultured Roseococcus sp.]